MAASGVWQDHAAYTQKRYEQALVWTTLYMDRQALDRHAVSNASAPQLHRPAPSALCPKSTNQDAIQDFSRGLPETCVTGSRGLVDSNSPNEADVS